MNFNKFFKFLKLLPKKLNLYLKKKSKFGVKVKNKSKSKKDFDPVTNIDKATEKFIRSLINKKFPNDSIIGEEFDDKFSSNNFQWSIDPIDGTRAFIIGAPTWSNLIGLSQNGKSMIGLANFPELNKFYLNNKKNRLFLKITKNLSLDLQIIKT